MIRTEATAPPVLEMVTLLVGKRSCGQCRREKGKGETEGQLGWTPTGPGRNFHSLPFLGLWCLELEEENHNKTINDIRNTRQEHPQLKFWTKSSPPPTANRHLLEALETCTSLQVLDLRLLLQTIPQDTPGYPMVPTDHMAFLRSHLHLSP